MADVPVPVRPAVLLPRQILLVLILAETANAVSALFNKNS
jgi:hypothetical protein